MRISAPRVRLAEARDAAAVAALHADSWRRHYRGAYAASYLDGDLDADRLAVWNKRLEHPNGAVTVVAVDSGDLVGFAHTIPDHDPQWGSLVENLHVVHDRHRLGIGGLLMATSAQLTLERSQSGGLYLWVLEQNIRAQRFYRALGGTYAEKGPCPPPGEVPERLRGQPFRLRFVWKEIAGLAEIASQPKAFSSGFLP